MGNSMQIIAKKLQLSNSSNPKVMELSPPKKCHELENFTCEICVENILFPEQKFKNRDVCSHPFCNDCIINFVKVKIEVDNTEKIKCPGLCCDFNLDILSCHSILPVKLFEKWCDILFEKAILGLDHCYCPNRKCSTLIVNECGGDVKRSVCHNCKQAFCFKCKTSWHAGFDCEETEQIKDSSDIAFGVLVEKNKWTRASWIVQVSYLVNLPDMEDMYGIVHGREDLWDIVLDNDDVAPEDVAENAEASKKRKRLNVKA
ncbi:E3 ubiquitin-protein ligase RSL1-like [Impatiens glandulifera]|uniref:E3 ubiquitin-protein ligase RSL1-like n=1 Tax=Impatiens glandulifera TaxID=253017 RepID=UPI001FB11C8B|nr:E3 ubiquitin-protein ligase RSL1-like [Impatiens glandulifera]